MVVPIDIFISYLFCIFCIFFFVLIARFLNFRREPWSAFNVFRVMFINARIEPLPGIREKIMYMTLIAVSFLFISDLVLSLTQVGFSQEEVSLETSKQIFEANLTVLGQQRNRTQPRKTSPKTSYPWAS